MIIMRPDWEAPEPNRLVYGLRCDSDNLIKIGTTVNLAHRRNNVRVESGKKDLTYVWSAPGTRRLGAALHAYFHDRRIHHEWFYLGDFPALQLADAVKYLTERYPDEVKNGHTLWADLRDRVLADHFGDQLPQPVFGHYQGDKTS